MELSVGEELYGFTVLSSEELHELEGTAFVMRHETSGARLLYLRNEDSNKAFSISFKTPPKDDTGVFHILEHSVLCGSEKFPVKEPFVNLLKSSMQTFLNAMTFPDKTMYPVASTNDQDLLNLADVYMDAVLHPLIYHKPAIFEQEGWHFELETDDADPSAPARLAVNGVVYNEMKGVMSNPNAVLYDSLQTALFPDNAYRHESGGLPSAVPTLTYEEFLDEHARHYSLANSYITLYGDLDLATMLKFLDERYLTPVAAEEEARAKARTAAGLPPLAPNPLAEQTAVVAPDVVVKMPTTPENACAACGFVIGDVREKVRCVAVDLLLDAIMGSNEAPLKRALLDAGLGADVHGSVADSIAQPFAVLEVRGLQEGRTVEEFRQITLDTLRELADGNLDHELLRASLAHAEFVMREHDFGMSDGVALSMAAMSGWLYDDDMATTYLRFEDDFAFLREALEEGYFERLIREVFLESGHWASVQLVAVPDAEPEEVGRLAALQADMTEADLEAIEEAVAVLRAVQEAPDTPEALATLPHLALSDLGAAPAEPPYRLLSSTPIPCVRHSVPTHGIVYASQNFELSPLTFEELPYASVLASVLGKLNTASHTASELDTLVNGALGDLSFGIDVYEYGDAELTCRPVFSASVSALECNADKAWSIPREILLETDFTDTDRIRDVLEQRRIAMEQSFVSAGHIYATMRVNTYSQPSALVNDALKGIEFYRFLKLLLADYDNRKQDLSARLVELSRRLFTDAGCTATFAGSEKAFETYWAQGSPTGRASGPDASAPRDCLAIPAPQQRNEAFIIPSDVSYVALGAALPSLQSLFNGAWLVAMRMISYDYLWNTVRVLGGAYGVGFQASRIGTMRFHSYRDPHLDETLAAYRETVGWLCDFNPDATEFEGFVVASVASFDTPLKARALARRQAAEWFAKRSPQDRLQTRSEAVHATLESVHALAEPLALAIEQNNICVFGSRATVEEAATPLTVVDLLREE